MSSKRADALLKSLFVTGCCAAFYWRLEIFVLLLLWPLMCVGALLWGGWEERAGVASFTGALVTTRLVYGLKASNPELLVIDGIFLAILVAVAVRSDRWWPSWAAAFQLAVVAIRLVFLTPGRPIELHAYLVGIALWTWLVSLTLQLAVWDRWRRRDGGRPRGLRPWFGPAAYGAMTALAFWYVWPALPSRLAEFGLATAAP